MCDFFSSMALPRLSYLSHQTDRAHHGGITILYKVEDFVLTIYCLIEDALYPAFCQQHGLPRRAGFPPALRDSECLTIELVGSYWGDTRQKQRYAQMHDRLGAWFPARRDRGAFTRQGANRWQVKAWRPQHLVARLGGDQAPGHAAGAHLPRSAPISAPDFPDRVRRRVPRTDAGLLCGQRRTEPPKYSPIPSAYGSTYNSNESRWISTDWSNYKSHTSRLILNS